jgi:hypothetical protein
MDFASQPSASAEASNAIVVMSFRMMNLIELGPPPSRFMVAGRLDHKVPKPHVSFRCSKRAGEPKSQKQFSGTSQPTAGTRTSDLRIGRNGRRAMSRRAGSQRRD